MLPCVRAVQPCSARSVAARAKGFGKSDAPRKGPKGKRAKKSNRAKGKGKGNADDAGVQQATRTPAAVAQPAGPKSELSPVPLEPPIREQAGERGGAQDDTEFEDRLAKLADTSALLAKEQRVKQAKEDNVLTQTSENVYASPPSILDSVTKASEDPDKVGPAGGGGGVGGLVIGGVLVVALVLGALGIDRGSSELTVKPDLSEEDRTALSQQLSTFKSRLSADADDADALEGAAVTYANLGEFKEAEGSLARLVTLPSKVSDPDAWRLLAETRSALKQTSKAVDAYARAFEIAGDDYDVVKGYTAALAADGRHGEAVSVLKALGDRVRSAQVQAAEDVAGSALEDTGSRDTAKRPAPVEVDLLLAKVYSQWKGHTSEAFETYDRIIAENPEDFKGYLGKGLLLRGEGRKGDADRAFLQARFLAPKEVRAVVDRIAAPER